MTSDNRDFYWYKSTHMSHKFKERGRKYSQSLFTDIKHDVIIRFISQCYLESGNLFTSLDVRSREIVVRRS